MARKRNHDSRPKFSTLDIDDEDEFPAGEPVEYDPEADDMYDEYAPDSFEDEYEDEYEDDRSESYIKAERFLTVVTSILSVILLLGSIVFWWYFVSRLTSCPIAILNWKLYPAMLICCSAVTLAFTISEIMRRKPILPENWMINICISGAVSTAIMLIFNTVTLGNDFSWMDAVTILCFSVSCCALPAAVYTALRAVFGCISDQVYREKAVDRGTLYADIRSQCEGRF